MSGKQSKTPRERGGRGAAPARASKKTRQSRGAKHGTLAARPKKSAPRSAISSRARGLDYIAAAARLLELKIDPSWHAAIEANLEATLQLSAAFMEFPLLDEAEPAPIFTA